MNKIIALLYKLARLLNDIDKIGSSQKIVRRIKNKWIGRKLIKRIW